MIFQHAILLAEDEDDEAFLLQRALKKAAISNPVQRVKNGEEVIQYLSGGGLYADRIRFPMPVIVLLDLNMPKKSGFEVLHWIRQQSSLKSMAVDIFSGSGRSEDIDRALGLGANLYLKKPIAMHELSGLLEGYRQVMACRGLVQF
jgi:DNA-binding response OmpR family regulator